MSHNINPRTARATTTHNAGELAKIAKRIAPAIEAVQRHVTEADGLTSPGDGRVRGGDRPDPTYAAATRRTTGRHALALEAVTQLVNRINLDIGQLAAWVDRWTDTELGWPRCTGGRSIDPWSDPTCTNYVDHYTTATQESRPRGDGLCVACRGRKQRYAAQEATQAAIR